MGHRGLSEVAELLQAAAAAYRAALGADPSVSGTDYDALVRSRSLAVIERGREYEAAADADGLPADQRVKWTGYLLRSWEPTDIGVPAAGPGDQTHDIVSLLAAAGSVVHEAGHIDEEALAAARSSSDEAGFARVDAEDRTGARQPVATKLEVPAVAEIVASRAYRDALQTNLQLAMEWITAAEAAGPGEGTKN